MTTFKSAFEPADHLLVMSDFDYADDLEFEARDVDKRVTVFLRRPAVQDLYTHLGRVLGYDPKPPAPKFEVGQDVEVVTSNGCCLYPGQILTVTRNEPDEDGDIGVSGGGDSYIKPENLKAVEAKEPEPEPEPEPETLWCPMYSSLPVTPFYRRANGLYSNSSEEGLFEAEMLRSTYPGTTDLVPVGTLVRIEEARFAEQTHGLVGVVSGHLDGDVGSAFADHPYKVTRNADHGDDDFFTDLYVKTVQVLAPGSKDVKTEDVEDAPEEAVEEASEPWVPLPEWERVLLGQEATSLGTVTVDVVPRFGLLGLPPVESLPLAYAMDVVQYLTQRSQQVNE